MAHISRFTLLVLIIVTSMTGWTLSNDNYINIMRETNTLNFRLDTDRQIMSDIKNHLAV